MSRFLADIEEEPAVLKRALDFHRHDGWRALGSVRDDYLSGGYDSIVFTGMGSSCYAPIAIQSKLSRAGFKSYIWEAGELLHYNIPSVGKKSMLLAISQSGESVETRKVVDQLKGRVTIATITNGPKSSIAQSSRYVLEMRSGEEATVSTKTYTNTLAVLHLLVSSLVKEDISSTSDRLQAVADLMDGFLKRERSRIKEISDFFGEATFLHFIGRGPSMAVANYGALIFNEGAHIYTCALPAGNFRHGVLELVEEGHRAIFFAPSGRTFDLTFGIAKEIAGFGSKVLLVTNEKVEDLDKNIYALKLGDVDEDLFPILAGLPVQSLLYEMARRKGWETGVFRRGGKVTTRE